MNTNLLNQAPAITENFIKSIPPPEFYSTILTRPKIANLYDKYYVPKQTQYQLTQEQVLRAIMVTSFRYINMSIQDVSVLLVYGLDHLGRADLDLTERHLAEKLASQNMDKNNIDVINRIIAQVVTKLPADLREKLIPLLRIRMIQKLNEELSHMYDFNARKQIEDQKLIPNPSDVAEPADVHFFNMEKKEGFTNMNKVEHFQDESSRLLANTPQTTSLDNNFLKDVEDIKNSLGEETVNQLVASGYSIEDITKNSIDMRFKAGDYEAQLRAINSMPANNKFTKDTLPENVIKGTYVQKDPQLQMDVKTKDLYYFDDYSGTLVPITDVEKIKGEDIATEKQLNTLLKDYDLSKDEVNEVLRIVKEKEDIIAEEEHVMLNTKEISSSTTNYLLYGAGAVLVIAVIVVIIMIIRKRRK